MTQSSQTSVKVYELAKELGLDSFGLLDVLKTIGVEVKNHMSSLEARQAEAAREFLLKKNKPAATAASAKKSGSAVRRTATRKSASGEAAAPAAAPVARTKSKPTESNAEVAPHKTKVIKRRLAKDEEEQHHAPVAKVSSELETEHTTVDAEIAFQSEGDEASGANVATSAASALFAKTPASAESAAIQSEEVDQKVKASTVVRRPRDTFADDEMLDRSFSQRKLKIIQNAPELSVPTAKTGATDADKTRKHGSDAASTEKAMFRPVTSVLDEQDEAQRRRGVTSERTLEDIKVADFRKREVIFQPKKRKLPPGKQVKKTQITTPGAHKRKIRIENTISINELAQRLSEKPKLVVKKLVDLGVDVGDNLNQLLDIETASLVAHEFQYEIENVAFDEKTILGSDEDTPELLQTRPPIVTVMGHVDHGKTTLLDAIRNASVASGEAGGITQHIGAYSVVIDNHTLTFLDTPGHEAFKMMRERGANVTDIVVLVVAADDGIMPQTKEAIAIAQAAQVPIVVAANKVDKPGANLEKLKQTLSENNVLIEEWGGEVPMVPVSALKKTGLKELLETIYLQADVLELKANPKCLAAGTIVEARMQMGKGIVADAIVERGTLRTGDFIVCGTSYGRVRAMMNDQGKTVKEVLPGFPVEFAGLNDVPGAGEKFSCVKSEADAKEITDHRKNESRKEKEKASERKPITLEDIFAEDPMAGKKQLNIMLKADVFGSVEAIADSINAIQSEKVAVKIVSKAVGVITDNDVAMARASNAHIYAFNVKPDAKAKETAKREEVPIHTYSIIYELLDGVKETMESLLDPIRIEKPLGKAEVRQAFTVSKIGLIAGSIVTDGKITRNSYAYLFRGNQKIGEGTIVSLKRFKDDAREIIKGQECGIGIEKYTDIQPGDRIEAVLVEYEKARL